MPFTQNLQPTFPKQPKLFTASMGNGDGTTTYKPLLDSAGVGSGANGAVIKTLLAMTTDTVNNVVQVAIGRFFAGITITNANPGVVTWSGANGNNASVGDMVVFLNNGNVLPGTTPPTFNTIYYVIAAGFTAGNPNLAGGAGASGAFQFSSTISGSGFNTTGTVASGTAIAVLVRPLVTFTVTAGAGFSNSVFAVSGMDAGKIGGLPIDSDGNPYFHLEASDLLMVNMTTAPAANKMAGFMAWGAVF